MLLEFPSVLDLLNPDGDDYWAAVSSAKEEVNDQLILIGGREFDFDSLPTSVGTLTLVAIHGEDAKLIIEKVNPRVCLILFCCEEVAKFSLPKAYALYLYRTSFVAAPSAPNLQYIRGDLPSIANSLSPLPPRLSVAIVGEFSSEETQFLFDNLPNMSHLTLNDALLDSEDFCRILNLATGWLTISNGCGYMRLDDSLGEVQCKSLAVDGSAVSGTDLRKIIENCSRIQRMDLRNRQVTYDLLNLIASKETMESVFLVDCDLTGFEPELTSIRSDLEIVIFSGDSLKTLDEYLQNP